MSIIGYKLYHTGSFIDGILDAIHIHIEEIRIAKKHGKCTLDELD